MSRRVSSKSTATPSKTSHSNLSAKATTVTKMEIVTPTTTPTQWFSLPWRKRNVSQPTSPLRRSSENSPARLATSNSSRLLSLDKALPPTPSDESREIKNFDNSESILPRSSHLPAYQKTPEVRNVSHLPPFAPPAPRGLCISLTSPSACIKTNISSPVVPITFLPTTSAEASSRSPQVRRTKSAHRLRVPNDNITSEQLGERRRRGVSFGATGLFMNPGHTTSKSKGNELERPRNSSKLIPQTLSRRPSFWSKKKSPMQAKSSPQTDGGLPISPLPLVDVSPWAPEFTIEPFQLSSPDNTTTIPSPFERLQSPNVTTLRTSHGSTTTSSTTSFEVVNSPLPKQESLSMLRGNATPPLLHRLSFGVFSSPEPSPVTRPSQYHSRSAAVLPFPSSDSDARIPRPEKDGESPEVYVLRLKAHVSKTEVASVLASSSDIFYTRALKAYLDHFKFSGIPLDVALRKLLMEVGLPRETQQIDRVMEAFAFRYRHCNPNLFASDDHPYILAFSLIMLHTDAFNPSNKRKMTKGNYIKNTKLPGVPTEVLDYFFDNIVFAPFIFIEDPEIIDNSSAGDSTGSVPTSTSVPGAGMTTFKPTNKVDPYYLIMNDLLDPLRVDVNCHIPLENPFTFEGIAGPWNEGRLHQVFLKAHLIDMDLPLAFRSMFDLYSSRSSSSPDVCQLYQAPCRLKVIKAGVLNKKDDLAEGGKKASSRKWKTCGMILSGSHLLFCRDPTWASISSPSLEPGGGVITKFRPDDIYCLKDCIAVYDRSYKKYNHTFRFVLPDGRHILLQAADDEDLQQWISCINYASTFTSVKVKIRPADISDIHSAGADASPHLQSQIDIDRPQSCRASTTNIFEDALSGQAQNKPRPRISRLRIDEDLFQVRGGDCISEPLLVSPRSLLSEDIGSLPRSELIAKKIRELDGEIAALQSHLESEERRARNIAILTPFRKTTRSKLLAAVQNSAKPLMRIRLDMEKLKCYRTVLRSDLISETRLRIAAKRTALRVATDPIRLHRPNTAPTMSPTYNEFGKQRSDTPASTSASFHSARESAFDMPSEIADGTPLQLSPTADVHKLQASIPPFPPFEPEHEDTVLETSSSLSQIDHNVPHRDSVSENVSQGDDDDQAEDWNKTRAAQRVSLIRVPSDFAIATRLKAVYEGNDDQS